MPYGGNDWLALTQEPTLEPELPICDAHHHFWDLRPERHSGHAIGERRAFVSSHRAGDLHRRPGVTIQSVRPIVIAILIPQQIEASARTDFNQRQWVRVGECGRDGVNTALRAWSPLRGRPALRPFQGLPLRAGAGMLRALDPSSG